MNFREVIKQVNFLAKFFEGLRLLFDPANKTKRKEKEFAGAMCKLEREKL